METEPKKNTLEELNQILFETLRTLKEAKPAFLETEIKRAMAMRLTTDRIITAGKLEVALRRLIKNIPQSKFFENLDRLSAAAVEPKQLGAGKKES